MKILEFKRSGIGLFAEFHGIPNGFPNQVSQCGYSFQTRPLLVITNRIKCCLLNHPVLKAILVGELSYLGEECEW
jgi:hypothetical protein